MSPTLSTTSIIDDILRREGGFVDNPDDPGGPTNFGITEDTLAAVRKHPVSIQDVRDLTTTEARLIYLERYIIRPHFDLITNPDLKALVVDSGVQHGTYRAALWLQRAASVHADGIFGPLSQASVNSLSGAHLYRLVLAHRCRFYGRIISRHPNQAQFDASWSNRLSSFILACP